MNKTSTPKGRILRVKKGYNPNSSSIGSDIFTYLSFAVGTGVLSVILMNTINSVGKLIKKNKDKLATPETPAKQ